MADIKTRPAMDKPKALNRDFVPKEAGNIWKQHHDQQEAQRGPKERGSVQYATDQVETTGRRGALAAVDGGRRVVREIKKHRDRDKTTDKETVATGPKKNNSSADAERQNSPYDSRYPSARRDGTEQTAEQRPRELDRKEAAKELHGRGSATENHSSIEVPRPKIKTRQRYPEAAVRRQNVIKSVDAQPVRGTAVQATQKVQQAAQQRLQSKMMARSTGTTQRGIRQLSQWAVTAAKAAAQSVKAATGGLLSVGGGVAVLILLLLLMMVGAIAASPFGILFSNESSTPNSVPVSAAIAEVNYDFNAQLEALQSADTYDDVTIAGDMADWVDVLAIFAVKTAGSNDADATDVVTMDADRVSRLKAVFADMHLITSTVETIHHGDNDPDDGVDDSWTEKILHITITGKTAAEMETEYSFTAQQITAVDELLAQREMMEELIGNLTSISADAVDVIRNLPAGLSPERRAVIRTACSLVGKVDYFWGGKSLTLGWDNRWGTVQKVMTGGSTSTGTYRPYGLDCSGFVDWVFYNATDGGYIIGHGGGARMQHTYCTSIGWDEAAPGDLVFYPDDIHVGIVAGWDESGNILIVHCASGYNNVVITGREGFVSIGRPLYRLIQISY